MHYIMKPLPWAPQTLLQSTKHILVMWKVLYLSSAYLGRDHMHRLVIARTKPFVTTLTFNILVSKPFVTTLRNVYNVTNIFP